jgi:ubiquinone/menaquinone biosynthesis C-methylase UbiE
MRRSKYEEQAETYDATRGASETVSRLLLRHLGEADGRTVLDLAGGTGNYAEVVGRAGFRTFILDLTAEMLARSVPKIGPGRQVVADVHRLPVRDDAVDAAICVSAIHQFPDIPAALREARRVIRDGPFVLQAFTAESLKPSFVFDYFPDPEAPEAIHPTEAEFEELLREAGFARVETERFVYEDLSDGTVHALQIDPEATADPERLRNTSFFQKLDTRVQEAGLAALRRDLESGLLAERVAEGIEMAEEYGQGAVFAAWP